MKISFSVAALAIVCSLFAQAMPQTYDIGNNIGGRIDATNGSEPLWSAQGQYNGFELSGIGINRTDVAQYSAGYFHNVYKGLKLGVYGTWDKHEYLGTSPGLRYACGASGATLLYMVPNQGGNRAVYADVDVLPFTVHRVLGGDLRLGVRASALSPQHGDNQLTVGGHASYRNGQMQVDGMLSTNVSSESNRQPIGTVMVSWLFSSK